MTRTSWLLASFAALVSGPLIAACSDPPTLTGNDLDLRPDTPKDKSSKGETREPIVGGKSGSTTGGGTSGAANTSGGTGTDCAQSDYQGQQVWSCSGADRYKCSGGTPIKESCTLGCFANAAPGLDDVCITAAPSWNCTDSDHQGQQLWTCSGTSLYRCDDATPQRVACANGCTVMEVGVNDTCK